MTTTRQSSIVYNSGTTIADPAYLATLCIFYDKVFLPYASGSNEELTIEIDQSDNLSSPSHEYEAIIAASALNSRDKLNGDWNHMDDMPLSLFWAGRHRVLFEEGVIERLSKPDRSNSLFNKLHRGGCKIRISKEFLNGIGYARARIVTGGVTPGKFR